MPLQGKHSSFIHLPFVLVIPLTSIFQFNGADLWITAFEHSARHNGPLKIVFSHWFCINWLLYDLCSIQLSMIYVSTWTNTGQCMAVRLKLTLFHHHHHHLLHSAVQVILREWICFARIYFAWICLHEYVCMLTCILALAMTIASLQTNPLYPH